MNVIGTFKSSSLEKEILIKFAEIIDAEMAEAQRIVVFGSRARGESNEHSDLDVAVVVDAPSGVKAMWARLWDIKWRILEALQAEEFPLSLSLVTANDLASGSSGFEKAIKTEGILIWERN